MNAKHVLDILDSLIIVSVNTGLILDDDNAANDIVESIGSIRVELEMARSAVSNVFAAARDAAAILQSKQGDMEQETVRRLYDALERAGALQGNS